MKFINLAKFRFAILAVVILSSCVKDEDSANFIGGWQLKSYNISYYNENNEKVFEESPSALSQYEKIIMSNTGFNFISQSAKSEKKGEQKLITQDVALSTFKGKLDGDGIMLEWSTMSEANNSYFEVERSGNTTGFVTIAKVSGIGNSNQENLYQYLDRTPLEEGNYYRLKQVNMDGSERYFDKIVFVRFGSGVLLSSFVSKVRYDGIMLKWFILSERNNAHFLLERSDDGAGFVTIAKVNGKGNSDQESLYEFLDINPFKGINYYRLKQVDYNGSEHVFPIVANTFAPLVNNEYPFTKDAEHYSFPMPLYDDKFQKVEIKRKSNHTMQWESKEADVYYLKDNTEVKAAYAKLLMEFEKL